MRILLGTLLAFAIIVALLWFVAAPVLIVQRVRTAFAELGFDDVQVEVESFGFRHLTLVDFELGRDEHLRVERIHVEFQLAEILRGRVGTVLLERVYWEPRLEPNANESAAPLAEARPPSAPTATTGIPGAPFDRLELRDSRVVIARDGVREELSAEGILEGTNHGWSGCCTVRARDQMLHAAFTAEEIDAALRGEAQVRAGHVDAPLDLQGPLEIRRDERGWRFRMDLQGGGAFRGGWRERGIAASSAIVALHIDADQPVGGGGRTELVLDLEVPEPRGLTLIGSALPPSVQELGVSGGLSLRATLLSQRFAASEIDLELHRVAVRSTQWHIEGCEGSFAVSGLPPLSSPAVQELRWKRLVVGKIAGDAGRISIALRPESIVNLSAARWHVGDGVISAESFDLDPNAARFATRVHLEQVALAPWMDLFSGGRAVGTGLLDGHFALRCSLRPLDIALGDGRLRTSGPGELRLADTPEVDDVLREHLGPVAAIDTAGRYDALVRDRIVQSLKDFAYRELTLDLVAAADDTNLRFHLVGEGRTVPQALDVKLNLNGANALIDLALGMQGALNKQADEARFEGVGGR